MELEKCSFYLSIWNFQADGYAFTIPPENLNGEISSRHYRKHKDHPTITNHEFTKTPGCHEESYG
jgi:hypothetical protein